jgi:hypothetical protein
MFLKFNNQTKLVVGANGFPISSGIARLLREGCDCTPKYERLWHPGDVDVLSPLRSPPVHY